MAEKTSQDAASAGTPHGRGRVPSTLVLGGGLLAVLVAVVAYLLSGSGPKPSTPGESPPRPRATTAHFSSIEGSVKVKTVGTFEWVNATKTLPLSKSDLVRTGPASAAEITFFDGTVVHVRPDSLITIEETSEDPSTKRRRVAWHISSGEVNLQTVRYNVPGSATEVSTPTVKGTVGENAAANIRVAELGDSDIRMFRGTSRVETKSGQRVELLPNEGLKVNAEGKAGAKVALPGAPQLLQPPNQVELVQQGTTGPARLEWRGVPEAASYHVMLDYSPAFRRPLVDRTGIAATVHEVRGLEEGSYVWRVAAIDKDGSEGAFSEHFAFALRRPLPSEAPPSLRIDALDVRGAILQIKGRTQPGATLTVNDQRVDVQPDGSFNEFLSLEQGKQEIVIRATGPNGASAEQRRTVVAAY